MRLGDDKRRIACVVDMFFYRAARDGIRMSAGPSFHSES